MDAYRVEEIRRYAAYAPRKAAKVILELLDDRRDKQTAFLGMMAERDAALARAERAEAERDSLLLFLREADSVGSFRDPAYQAQFIERHHAWLARAALVEQTFVGWYDSHGVWHPPATDEGGDDGDE